MAIHHLCPEMEMILFPNLFDSVSGYSRPITQTITLTEQNYIQSTQLTTTKLAKTKL